MAWGACGLFPLPRSCQDKWLSLRCKNFSGFFDLIVLGYMLNGYFSSKYRCKLKLAWKLETVAGSYSSPFFLRAFKQILTTSGQAWTQVSFQFSPFSYHYLQCSNQSLLLSPSLLLLFKPKTVQNIVRYNLSIFPRLSAAIIGLTANKTLSLWPRPAKSTRWLIIITLLAELERSDSLVISFMGGEGE